MLEQRFFSIGLLLVGTSLVLSASTGCRPAETGVSDVKRRELAERFANVGWPSLNGPTGHNGSYETELNWSWKGDKPDELWRCEVGNGYGSPVVVPDHLVVLHRVGDEEFIESFQPETGKSQWQYRYPTTYECKFNYSNGPYSTPVVNGDRVYTVGAQGQLHCLRIQDGSLVWKRLLQEDFQKPEQLFCVGASPLVEDDRLIFNLGSAADDAGILAIDKMSGETLWKATDYGPSYATPVAATIHQRRIVFVVTFEGLVALEPATGNVLWNYPLRPTMSLTVNATSPIVNDDCVIMSTGPGPGTVCLRVLPDGSYEEVWRIRRGLDSQFNTMVLIDGHLYGFSSLVNHGSFRCVDAATGEERWEYRSDLRRGQGLAVDGRFVLLGEFGHLASVAVTPKKPIVHSMTRDAFLEPPCYSSPAVFRGLLYLRNEGTLVCLNLRQPLNER